MALNWGPRPERDSLSAALALIWKAYVPIPRRILDFWNTNVLDRAWVSVGRWHVSPDLLQAGLSLGLVAVGAWVLARARIWLVLYGVTTAGLAAFMHVKYYAGLRHGGHLVILFVISVWLSLVDARRRDGPALHSTDWTGRLRTWGVTALLAAQIPAALMAVRTEIAHPFSRAHDVAQYLRTHGLLELPIVASKYNITSSVALHVNRPVLYAELSRTSTFIRWMAGRRPVSPTELLAMAEQIGAARRTPVLLLTSYPLPLDDNRLIKLASFDDDAISDERYTIYLRDHPDAPSGLARSQGSDVVKSGEDVKREM